MGRGKSKYTHNREIVKGLFIGKRGNCLLTPYSLQPWQDTHQRQLAVQGYLACPKIQILLGQIFYQIWFLFKTYKRRTVASGWLSAQCDTTPLPLHPPIAQTHLCKMKLHNQKCFHNLEWLGCSSLLWPGFTRCRSIKLVMKLMPSRAILNLTRPKDWRVMSKVW